MRASRTPLRLDPRSPAGATVCSWCVASRSADRPPPSDSDENYGICKSCLRRQLKSLRATDRAKPVRTLHPGPGGSQMIRIA